MTAVITPYPISGLFNGNYDRSHTRTFLYRFRCNESYMFRDMSLGKKHCKLCNMNLYNSQGNLYYNHNGIP